jgi:hypothetical protein
MTALARTVAALAEVNPPVAAAVRAIGPNGSGWPLPGYLGWLPEADLADLGRAFLIGHQVPITPLALADACAGLRRNVWRNPRGWQDEASTHEAVIAWSRAAGREPLVDLLEVKEGRTL